MLLLIYLSFGGGNFLKITTDMYGVCLITFLGFPGNGTV